MRAEIHADAVEQHRPTAGRRVWIGLALVGVVAAIATAWLAARDRASALHSSTFVRPELEAGRAAPTAIPMPVVVEVPVPRPSAVERPAAEPVAAAPRDARARRPARPRRTVPVESTAAPPQASVRTDPFVEPAAAPAAGPSATAASPPAPTGRRADLKNPFGD
jgi:hypothetical protein